MSDDLSGMPEVTDEAGPSPRWVPFVGLGLLILALAGAAYFVTNQDAAADSQVNADGGSTPDGGVTGNDVEALVVPEPDRLPIKVVPAKSN